MRSFSHPGGERRTGTPMGARRPVIVMTLLATPFLLTAKGAAPAAGERRLPL